MNYILALDIGVSSVGYAVINYDYEVICSGVRLFECADSSKNVERRSNRGARRLGRRKAHRIERFEKFCKTYKIEPVYNTAAEPVLLRCKGLESRLSEEELYIALKHLLKNRGISYLDDADDSSNSNSDYKKAILQNKDQMESKLPCQIQYERLRDYGCYRGDRVIDGKPYSNVFTISSYIKEIDKLLSKQAEFHRFIDNNFIEGYKDIFNSKREYFVGPGNHKSRTDYGIYTTKLDEDGNYITDDNLFEKLIGKCSIYKDQLRASSASYTAQEFNALNDLNNLNINGRKLNTDEKKEIIKKLKTEKTVRMRKIIKEVIHEDIYDLKGARIDKNEKEIFHTFETYRKMKKSLSASIDLDEIERCTLDKIGSILTINTDKESILKAFNREEINLSDTAKEALVNFRKSSPSMFSKWHSFSLKIMNELIQIMYEEPKEQMQLLVEMGKFTSNLEIYRNYKKIPANVVTEEIFNPVVSKSVTQSINIINKFIEIYGNPNQIVIEMPRDKNEDEKIKRIKSSQKKYEKELTDILDYIKDSYDITINDSDFYKQKTLKTKLRLWKEQNEKCLYSGKKINIMKILDDPNLFEVDHIIPISISYDDSRNNKVLVFKSENQLKGKKTPYQYLRSRNSDWNYEVFNTYVNSLNIPLKKKQNLLFKDDITKRDVLKGFISRNLNDTRYASKVVLNALQSFMKVHETGTKIKVINGAFTAQLRNRIKIDKNRDAGYDHHALDAIIIAYSQMGLNNYYNQDIIDVETGEILDLDRYLTLTDDEKYEYNIFYEKIIKMKANIELALKNVKYSHKVDKKANRVVSNDTIYGTREKEGKRYIVEKIKDIYDVKAYKTRFKKKKPTDFIMYHNDRQTWDILCKIEEDYENTENPFLKYKEEFGEPIRKYSKKGNGPFITSLKYYSKELGSHIDISNKYGYKKGDKKVVLQSLKPYRTDVYYKPSDGTYHLVGIKYSDFKFVKNKYILTEDKYNEILINEKILKKGQDYKNIKLIGYEFRFSLYKNDIIYYEKDQKTYKERFLSRTLPNKKNYIETKPIATSKYLKQNLIGLTKASKILKVNTDILGNEYITKKERFVLNIPLDNC